ncbi:MAG: hypothetical protein IJW83_00040 [Clostridia bacterium]|nr:hypothetical protein [Clostridia bacterium]
MTEKDLNEYITLKRRCLRAKEYYEEFASSFGDARSQRYDIEPGGGTAYSPDTISPQIEEKDRRKKAYDDAYSEYIKRGWEIERAMNMLTENEKDFVVQRYILGVRNFYVISASLHRSVRSLYRDKEEIIKKIANL